VTAFKVPTKSLEESDFQVVDLADSHNEEGAAKAKVQFNACYIY
jgi:hypothetical protein